VEVETRESTDAGSKAKQFGVYIQVREGARIERANASFVDLDEIESLIKGIEYISGLKSDVTKLTGFQAEYRTKGDLAVSTFSSGKGNISALIKSGRYGTVNAFITAADLTKFRELLRAAQTTLQSLKGP
jgi:hypothetical protein